MLRHWKIPEENQVGRVDLIISWVYDYIAQVSHNRVYMYITYISRILYIIMYEIHVRKYQFSAYIITHRFYLIDVDKKCHTYRAQISFFAFIWL